MSDERTLNRLAEWLLDPSAEAPASGTIRSARLSGYAYTALPEAHPERGELRASYLESLARHQGIKSELVQLVAAWNREGIEPLLFKGFHLAEFVYPVPGARFHGDVDVLVRSDQVETARLVARQTGWTERDVAAERGRPASHNVSSLSGPERDTCVDLHQWVIHAVLPWAGVQRRITREVLDAANRRDWEGVRILEPAPVDALLVGLILQRCWGGDRWRLKAHDAVDFRMLARVPGVDLASLEARARQLKAERTLRIYLERCNPWEGRLELGPPTAAETRRWDRRVQRERPMLGRAERLLARTANAPGAALDVFRALPSVFVAHAALRRECDMSALLEHLTPRPGGMEERNGPGHGADFRTSLRRSVRGVRWATRLLPRNVQGDCLLRSLALYHILRKSGFPARFVSGVRRDAAGVAGHAWVELDGEVVNELREPDNRRHYAVNFEYPPIPVRSPPGSQPAVARTEIGDGISPIARR
jgi:hypothetical protein